MLFITRWFHSYRWPIPPKIRLFVAKWQVPESVFPAWARPLAKEDNKSESSEARVIVSSPIVYMNIHPVHWKNYSDKNTAVHELAHCFWGHKAGHNYPNWLSEGLACWVQEEWEKLKYRRTHESYQRNQCVMTTEFNDRLRLIAKKCFWRFRKKGASYLLYESSRVAVTYLNGLGPGRFHRFVRSVMIEHKGAEKTLKSLYGAGRPAIQQRLRTLARQGRLWDIVPESPLVMNAAITDSKKSMLIGLAYDGDKIDAPVVTVKIEGPAVQRVLETIKRQCTPILENDRLAGGLFKVYTGWKIPPKYYSDVATVLAHNGRYKSGNGSQPKTPIGSSNREKAPVDGDIQTLPDDLEIALGENLLSVIGQRGHKLIHEIGELRTSMLKIRRIRLPRVRIRNWSALSPNEYQILIKDCKIASFEIMPNRLLARQSDSDPKPVPGWFIKEPTTGTAALWIRPKDAKLATKNGFTVADPVEIMVSHLKAMTIQHSSMLLDKASRR